MQRLYADPLFLGSLAYRYQAFHHLLDPSEIRLYRQSKKGSLNVSV